MTGEYAGAGESRSGIPDRIVPLGISAPELQEMIEDAPAGATIRFQAGRYEFSSKIEIRRGDIALEGAGIGRTMLEWSFPPGSGDNALEFVGGTAGPAFKLASDAKASDRTIRIRGENAVRPGAVRPGDAIHLSQPNDDAYFDAIGFRRDAVKPWMFKFPLRETLAVVEKVEGSLISLSLPVGFDYSAGSAAAKRLDLLAGVSISDMTITYAYGRADPLSWGKETLPDFKMHTYALRLDGLRGPRLRNIHVQDAASGAFGFYRTYGLDGERLSSDGAHNKKGGQGYAVHLGTVFASRLRDLSDRGMRHSVTFHSWSANAYNDISIDFTDRDVNFHGGRSHHNQVLVKRSDVYDGHGMWIPAVYWNMDGERWGPPSDVRTNRVTFENAVGGRNKDDLLIAAAGGARLDGKSGNNILVAGPGDDVLSGGSGADTFVICADGSHDTIVNFDPKTDILAVCDAGRQAGRSGVTALAVAKLASGVAGDGGIRGGDGGKSPEAAYRTKNGTRVDLGKAGGGTVDIENASPSDLRILDTRDLPEAVKRMGLF
ncbi:hypothetical protein JL100_006735 [Skermanella mucosa]|uniref:hypothetical protein n=1 Tax=Skermanella mucosa TaxID=1789672 RepID=UPI00192CD277|nr:hypothetical protein [Skermanella mucosa]UEM22436.1 hypothetical protein JL100_006735 [Skermanella mucosa]